VTTSNKAEILVSGFLKSAASADSRKVCFFAPNDRKTTDRRAHYLRRPAPSTRVRIMAIAASTAAVMRFKKSPPNFRVAAGTLVRKTIPCVAKLPIAWRNLPVMRLICASKDKMNESEGTSAKYHRRIPHSEN